MKFGSLITAHASFQALLANVNSVSNMDNNSSGSSGLKGGFGGMGGLFGGGAPEYSNTELAGVPCK